MPDQGLLCSGFDSLDIDNFNITTGDVDRFEADEEFIDEVVLEGDEWEQGGESTQYLNKFHDDGPPGQVIQPEEPPIINSWLTPEIEVGTRGIRMYDTFDTTAGHTGQPLSREEELEQDRAERQVFRNLDRELRTLRPRPPMEEELRPEDILTADDFLNGIKVPVGNEDEGKDENGMPKVYKKPRSKLLEPKFKILHRITDRRLVVRQPQERYNNHYYANYKSPNYARKNTHQATPAFPQRPCGALIDPEPRSGRKEDVLEWYRSMARKFHPDKTSEENREVSNEIMMYINKRKEGLLWYCEERSKDGSRHHGSERDEERNYFG